MQLGLVVERRQVLDDAAHTELALVALRAQDATAA